MSYFDNENLEMFKKDFDFSDCADDEVTTFYEDIIDKQFINDEQTEEEIKNAEAEYMKQMKENNN